MQSLLRPLAAGRALSALALVVSLLASAGCGTTPTPEPFEALAAEESNPPFFRVESHGATMHILGSVHVGPPGGWALPRFLEREFEAAEVYVFEVAALDPQQTALVLRKLALLPPDRNLRSVLGADLYRRLAGRFRTLGSSLSPLAQFEPWVAGLQLVLLEFTSAGFDAEGGIDTVLMARVADEAMGEIVGLETIEEQLRLLDAMSPDLQRLQLELALEDPSEATALVLDMANAWQQGDDDALLGLLQEQSSEHPELERFNEAVFTERNHSMSAKLDALLAAPANRGPIFVTIGAGHVVGPEAVPALLAERGHRVERVRPALR